MFGIATRQVARINVVNTAAADTLAKPIWVQGWANPHSELVSQAAFLLEPGASAFLDVDREAIAAGDQQRHQIRAGVTVLHDAPGACVATLELFDKETGKTAVFVPLTDALPVP